ncbi:MAG: FAD-dependent oxidoreductase [Bdellovibrionales bacterium]|nr:FAD-dependent oxidoreductase [Bdellovibrionales bacterium]
MQKNQVTIIGAGFSGLVTAFALVQKGLSVKIYEKESRAGGLIQTQNISWDPETHFPDETSGTLSFEKDQFYSAQAELQNTTHREKYIGSYETGANGILNCQALEFLCNEIKLNLFSVPKSGQKKYIFRQKIRRWPFFFWETLILLILLLRMFWKKSARPKEQESIKQWCERQFNLIFFNYLLDPILSGIYAGDGTKLSARLLFAKKRKKPQTLFPKKGMGEFVECLKNYLISKNVTFHFCQEWPPLSQNHEPTIVATSAPAASRLIQNVSPIVSQLINQIEMLPLVTAQCFYKEKKPPVTGFGCLFPRKENFQSLGVLFDSNLFPWRNSGVSERWILGGANNPDLIHWSDEKIILSLQKDRSRLYQKQKQNKDQSQTPPLKWEPKVESSIIKTHITRWHQALPHYTLQLESILNQIHDSKETLPQPTPSYFWMSSTHKLALIGNYWGGIGLSSILESSFDLADKIYLQWESHGP